MKIQQLSYSDGNWSNPEIGNGFNPDLVLCFGNRELINSNRGYDHLKTLYPKATLVASSTAGEISESGVSDDGIIATAIQLQGSSIESVISNVRNFDDSFKAGKDLISKLDLKGLKFVLVLSDGQLVNGSDLVRGINSVTNQKIPVAGGLAGDGTAFTKTLVGLNEDIDEGNVVAIGFYGENIRVGYGSEGGWDQFGPSRTVTRSVQNKLFEIDGQSAYDLYVKYLGDHAKELPASALLFPLCLELEDGSELVRTILAVDGEEKSMTFAGDIPEGCRVRLMKANFDNLVDAAHDAANQSCVDSAEESAKLSILISCVGRKLILGDRIDEEVEAAKEALGQNSVLTGFYSYGEISPYAEFLNCQLHNQTMTITTLTEA